MSNLIFQLHCDFCNWKRLVKEAKDTEDLYEMPLAQLQKTLPKLEDGKTVASTFVKQKRQFRCPSCGRYCFPKAILDTQKNLNDKLDLEKRVAERKKDEDNWFAGRKNSPKGPPIP